MLVDGPILEACVSCWAPAFDGVATCDCDEGLHRWQATHAWFVVAHPAVPTPLAGRFAYPVDTAKVARFLVRHRRMLRRRFAVDPKAAKARYWVEVDVTVPAGLVPPVVVEA